MPLDLCRGVTEDDLSRAVCSRASQRGRIVKREYGPSRTFVVMGCSELEVEAAGEGERGRCIIVPMGMAQK